MEVLKINFIVSQLFTLICTYVNNLIMVAEAIYGLYWILINQQIFPLFPEPPGDCRAGRGSGGEIARRMVL